MISKTKSAWFEKNKGHCYFLFALKLNSHSSNFFSQKRREGQFVSQRQRPLWLLLYPCSWFSIKTGSGLHLIDFEWELKIEISRGRYWSSSFDFGSELNIQMNRGGQGSFSIDNIRIEHWNEQRRAVFNPNWCWTRIENWTWISNIKYWKRWKAKHWTKDFKKLQFRF